MAAYLYRALSGGIGHRRYLKGYDCGPNSIVRNNEERSWAPRRFSWYRATWPTSPPRPIALSHRITYACTLQSCHGAVVAPISNVPQEGSSVFSLFSLIKLHLASLPLPSSYSRVAVSSVFWAQNIFFSAQTRGAPLTGWSLILLHVAIHVRPRIRP